LSTITTGMRKTKSKCLTKIQKPRFFLPRPWGLLCRSNMRAAAQPTNTWVMTRISLEATQTVYSPNTIEGGNRRLKMTQNCWGTAARSFLNSLEKARVRGWVLRKAWELSTILHQSLATCCTEFWTDTRAWPKWLKHETLIALSEWLASLQISLTVWKTKFKDSTKKQVNSRLGKFWLKNQRVWGCNAKCNLWLGEINFFGQ